MIELKNIEKVFNRYTINESPVFKDFNLKIESGEFVSVIGSNGSGKSTLLNLICGNVFPDSGSIKIDGNDITNKKDFLRYKKIGRVFQDPKMGTCPSMTILENISMAENKNSSWGLKSGIRKEKIGEYKEMLRNLNLGLENKLNSKVSNLSGGQRQALALLIATLTDIDFLILDEHTAALDPKTADIIMELTQKIVREKNLTTIMVTHNLKYSLKYGDRILMMHEGKIIIDKKGEEKDNLELDDILNKFYEISIEYGNSI